MRAMFKAVLNNEQVLYLCPTTILSKQHSKGNLSAPDEVIYAKLRGNISCLCKLKLAIDVLDEMHLVTRGPGGRHVAVVPNPQKVDISQSKILRELQSRSLPAGV